MEFTVKLTDAQSRVIIEKGCHTHLKDYMEFNGRVMVVTDDNIPESLKETVLNQFENAILAEVPQGEKAKSLEIYTELLATLLENEFSRKDFVIALGGGVIGDLTGFAAASYLRGVKFIQVPTSLLAQVDSSVGGKVAVDLPEGKNLVGAFYQPALVLIDPTVLKTLPKRFINDGMGEVIKYGCIKDASLFELLEKYNSFEELTEVLPSIIERCVDIKRIVVEHDQFDTGERMLLNFGHTLAHTIEQRCNYERESHGEAVGIGMYQLSLIAEE